MSKPISWRPSDAAAKALADLIARTGKKKAKLLDDLILSAARGPEIKADNDRGSAATARARMLGDNIRRNEALNERIVARATAQGVDPEKIAAFQRKAGMDIFDAKRRR